MEREDALHRASIPYSFIYFILHTNPIMHACLHAHKTSDATKGAGGTNTTAALFAYVRRFPVETVRHKLTDASPQPHHTQHDATMLTRITTNTF